MSEAESLTMVIKISKDEHTDLFLKMSNIHNKRSRGIVLRNLASLGLVNATVVIPRSEVVTSVPEVSEAKPAVVPIRINSDISRHDNKGENKSFDIGNCNFAIPDF